MVGQLVKAAMDGGSSCALPKGTWGFLGGGGGSGERRLNSSPCSACQAECPSICVHLPQVVCHSLKTPENLAATQRSRLGSQTPFWSLATPTSLHFQFLECSCLVPTQDLCTSYFLLLRCVPRPFPAWFTSPSDFSGIITSSGKHPHNPRPPLS